MTTSLAVAVAVAVRVAQSSPDPTGGLLSYGVLGIVVVCLLSGLLVPGWLYKRSEAENDRLRKLIDDKVYPLVEAGAKTQEQANEVMREMIRNSQAPTPRPRAPRRAQ